MKVCWLFIVIYVIFIPTVYGKTSFTEVHNRRVALQRRNDVAHKQLYREHTLRDQFSKWYKKVSEKDKKEIDFYELLRRFCIDDVTGGCSWTEANFLLSHTSDMVKPPIEKNQVKQMLQDWVFPSAYMKQSMPTKLKSKCKRINHIPSGLEFLTEYVIKNVPLVIEGGAAQWPALKKWDIRYLNNSISTDVIKLYTSLDGDFEKVQTVREWKETLNGIVDFDEKDGSKNESFDDPDEVIMIRPAETEFTFAQFAKIVTEYPNDEHASFYLQKQDMRKWKQLKLIRDISPLLFGPNEDANVHPFKAKSKKKKEKQRKKKHFNIETNGFGFSHFLNLEHFFLWAGVNNTRGPIHYDENENLFAMIKGSKTFELFHGHESESMYESEASYRTGHLMFDLDLTEDEWSRKFGPDTRGNYYSIPVSSTTAAYQPFSPVNVSHPDYNKHPKFKNARRVTCQLNPGDILYLPSYWWHEVSTFGSKSNDGLALGVNAFFSPYWKKGSDLKHFTRSHTYAHINQHIVSNIEEIFRMIREQQFDMNNVIVENSYNIEYDALEKMLDVNYWRVDGHDSSSESNRHDVKDVKDKNGAKTKKHVKNSNKKKKIKKATGGDSEDILRHEKKKLSKQYKNKKSTPEL